MDRQKYYLVQILHKKSRNSEGGCIDNEESGTLQSSCGELSAETLVLSCTMWQRKEKFKKRNVDMAD